jgi:hypothetical protein
VLVAVGVYALVAPHSLAHHYGVPVEGHREGGFVRATGVRDVALGVVLAAAAYFHAMALLIVFATAAIVVSIVDLWIVSHHGGVRRFHPAHVIHGSGIVAFILVLSMALFAVGR